MLQVYERIEPTGELKADIRNAMICELLASYIWAKGGGKGKQPQITDFIIDHWDELQVAVQQDAEEMRNNIFLSLGLKEYVTKSDNTGE